MLSAIFYTPSFGINYFVFSCIICTESLSHISYFCNQLYVIFILTYGISYLYTQKYDISYFLYSKIYSSNYFFLLNHLVPTIFVPNHMLLHLFIQSYCINYFPHFVLATHFYNAIILCHLRWVLYIPVFLNVNFIFFLILTPFP